MHRVKPDPDLSIPWERPMFNPRLRNKLRRTIDNYDDESRWHPVPSNYTRYISRGWAKRTRHYSRFYN